MRAYLSALSAFALLVLTSGCFAGDIKPGATMRVKPNSIWFDEAAQLSHWHKLKKNGDAAALAAYQDEKLRARDAWQFINPLTVKILGYDPKNNQVHVKMLAEGRFVGLDFYLDPDALTQ
jgi:outer membrane biogenesis lipoprotein LolB